MTSILPEFAQLDNKIIYDTSVERTEIIELPCSKTTIPSLNQQNSQLNFAYNGDFLYRLSSPNSGFLFKFRFRTQRNNANDRNANITLASNFFGYMFDQATLKLGGQIIEQIRFPGIVMDCFYHSEEIEFRKYSGQL